MEKYIRQDLVVGLSKIAHLVSSWRNSYPAFFISNQKMAVGHRASFDIPMQSSLTTICSEDCLHRTKIEKVAVCLPCVIESGEVSGAGNFPRRIPGMDEPMLRNVRNSKVQCVHLFLVVLYTIAHFLIVRSSEVQCPPVPKTSAMFGVDRWTV